MNRTLLHVIILLMLLPAACAVTPEMVLVLPTPDPNSTYLPYEEDPNDMFSLVLEGGQTISLLSQDQMLNDLWLRMWARSAMERDAIQEIANAYPSDDTSDDFLLAVYMEQFLQVRHSCAEDAEETAALIEAYIEVVRNMGYVEAPILATVMSLSLYFGSFSGDSVEPSSCWDGMEDFKAHEDMIAWCFFGAGLDSNECIDVPSMDIIGQNE